MEKQDRKLELFDGQKAPKAFYSDISRLNNLDPALLGQLTSLAVRSEEGADKSDLNVALSRMTGEALAGVEDRQKEIKKAELTAELMAALRIIAQILRVLVRSHIDRPVIEKELTELDVNPSVVQQIFAILSPSLPSLREAREKKALIVVPSYDDMLWRVSWKCAESEKGMNEPILTARIIARQSASEDGRLIDYIFEADEDALDEILSSLAKAKDAMQKAREEYRR